MDGNSSPRARGLVLQVSKHGAMGSKGWVERGFKACKYCNILSVNDESLCSSFVRNISWLKKLVLQGLLSEYAQLG